MFLLSKLLGLVTDPALIFYILLFVGMVLSYSRRLVRIGRRILSITLLVITILAVVPIDDWAMGWMEDRFPYPAELPDHVDGIIVLGGAINPIVSAARGQVSSGGALTRMTALVSLARRYPDARLIFSGGSGDPMEQSLKEADYAIEFYRDIGFDVDRVVFERQSRNTRENAILSKEAMAPLPGQTWLLLTSAGHMMRSVGCFRAAGWPVVAVPVDYHTTGQPRPWWKIIRFSPAKGIGGMSSVLHEGMGLMTYHLMGWTDAFLPAP